MATEDKGISSSSGDQDRTSRLKQRRLEHCFEHASRLMAQEEYDFTYAGDQLAQCVVGNPSNPAYAQAFLENLYKKYDNNRRGNPLAMISGLVGRSGMKRAISRADWDTAIKLALKVLTLNPWDTATLKAMASINDALKNEDTQFVWLKSALASNPKDADVNRQCAVALAKHNQYDQAIACWHRVERARPGDEEASQQISLLALQKARVHGAFDTGADATPLAASRAAQAAEEEASPEALLRIAIAANPENLQNYYDLAQIYINDENFKEAEPVLAQAVKIAPKDIAACERWEDAQLRHMRQRVTAAEKAAKTGGGEAAQQEFKRLQREFRVRDMEVYQARCDRYPTNLVFKYELGVRHQVLGDYNEAIKEFQFARNEPRNRGKCLLHLAQCFQQIKQSRLAMTHYTQAIEELPDRDASNKKLALYQAGRLALGLKEKKLASQYLTALAQLDFSYKDVSGLLDKLEELGDDESKE